MALKVVTFKIEDNLLILLDMYAAKHKLNRSEVIRRAVEKLVREDLEKENDVITAKVEKISLR